MSRFGTKGTKAIFSSLRSCATPTAPQAPPLPRATTSGRSRWLEFHPLFLPDSTDTPPPFAPLSEPLARFSFLRFGPHLTFPSLLSYSRKSMRSPSFTAGPPLPFYASAPARNHHLPSPRHLGAPWPPTICPAWASRLTGAFAVGLATSSPRAHRRWVHNRGGRGRGDHAVRACSRAGRLGQDGPPRSWGWAKPSGHGAVSASTGNWAASPVSFGLPAKSRPNNRILF
jgi:hypothetical protein